MRKLTLSIGVLALSACGLAASAHFPGVDTARCLVTRVAPGQEIADIFSRDISFQIDGYDPYVRRVSGTGYYRVKQVTTHEIVTTSTFLYDGSPASTADTTIKDAGRTVCWKGDCSPSTDASGLSINPLLWGKPRGLLHVGQSWEVVISVPWELGPGGKQTVRVVALDPANDTVTLERSGSGEGDSANEIKKLNLTKDKKTYAVQVSAGKARWSGITTFQRGVILSDSLLMMRPVTISSPDFGQSTGTERQYILLNASSPELLRGPNDINRMVSPSGD